MDTARGTQDQILDAAERLFGSRGYANVTISHICKASGLPVGSVYHHFGSKSGVLKAVLERGTSEFFVGLPAVDDLAGSPLSRLAAYYEAAADRIVKRLPLFRLLASLQLHQADSKEVQAILQAVMERGMARVVAFIEPVARNCGVRDADECARELAALNIVFMAGLAACADNPNIDVRTGIGCHLHRLVLASIIERAKSTPSR